MVNIELEKKACMILNLELDLLTLDHYLNQITPFPIGLYLANKRKPFTYEEHGLIIHPDNIYLNLDDIPTDTNKNIINKNGELLIPGYHLSNNRNKFSNRPFLALLSIDFLHTLFDHLQYTNNKYKNLYYENPLIGGNEYLIDGLVKNFVFVEDVVLYYFNRLPKNIIDMVNDIVYNRMIPMINDFILADTNAYYEISTDSENILITKYDDLRTIRYLEAVDLVAFETTLNKEYDENI